MNIFDSSFVTAIKSEIRKQLAANKEPVTRNSVLATLDLGLDAEGLKDAELAVSLAFRLGLVPEYKMFQKIGIKSADYVPASKRKKEKEPKEEKPQRKLNPKVQARVDANKAVEEDAETAETEELDSEETTSEETTSEE